MRLCCKVACYFKIIPSPGAGSVFRQFFVGQFFQGIQVPDNEVAPVEVDEAFGAKFVEYGGGRLAGSTGNGTRFFVGDSGFDDVFVAHLPAGFFGMVDEEVDDPFSGAQQGHASETLLGTVERNAEAVEYVAKPGCSTLIFQC